MDLRIQEVNWEVVNIKGKVWRRGLDRGSCQTLISTWQSLCRPMEGLQSKDCILGGGVLHFVEIVFELLSCWVICGGYPKNNMTSAQSPRLTKKELGGSCQLTILLEARQQLLYFYNSFLRVRIIVFEVFDEFWQTYIVVWPPPQSG